MSDQPLARGLWYAISQRLASQELRIRGHMLYMIIERFRDGDPLPVYRRLRDRGRMAPDGLHYVASWVTEDLKSCFQVMESDAPHKLEEWLSQWQDLGDFEVIPVITSADAQALVAPRL